MPIRGLHVFCCILLHHRYRIRVLAYSLGFIQVLLVLHVHLMVLAECRFVLLPELLINLKVSGVQLVTKFVDHILAFVGNMHAFLGLFLHLMLLMLPLLGVVHWESLHLADHAEFMERKRFW